MKLLTIPNLNLSKKDTYILACSYGPDSMALFKMLLEQGYKFVVAHVNYHILSQADEDEKGIKEYCLKHKIKFYSFSTYMPEGVNEEIWAREVRYDYFAKLAKELNIKKVLVAHTLNDLIETYLLQKDRGSEFLYYGIKEESIIKGVMIIRPLLSFTKEQLLSFNKIEHVPYSIDPSNEDTKFKRNKFRKELGELTEDKISFYLNEINGKNLQNSIILNKYFTKTNKKSLIFDKDELTSLTQKNFHLLLLELLKRNEIFKEISLGLANEILTHLKNNKYFSYELSDGETLEVEYNEIYVFKKVKPYSFVLAIGASNFIFSFNKENVNYPKLINENETYEIKPVKESDLLIKDKKTYKVNRLFISWKVPHQLRKIWPGIYNKDNILIYVPRYQREVKEKNGLLIFDLNDLLN